jgi:hypothetical protein
MEARRAAVLLPNGQEGVIWFCGRCGIGFQGEASQDVAEHHCTCRYCGQPTEGPRGGDIGGSHAECWRKEQHDRYIKRLDAAEKLDLWGGWVYAEGFGCNDGFFDSLGTMVEELEDNTPPEEWPEYAFICNEQPFGGIDLTSVLESCTDDMYEDAADDLKGVDELRAAIDRFNDINKELHSYQPDYKRAVRVPRGEARSNDSIPT